MSMLVGIGRLNFFSTNEDERKKFSKQKKRITGSATSSNVNLSLGPPGNRPCLVSPTVFNFLYFLAQKTREVANNENLHGERLHVDMLLIDTNLLLKSSFYCCTPQPDCSFSPLPFSVGGAPSPNLYLRKKNEKEVAYS